MILDCSYSYHANDMCQQVEPKKMTRNVFKNNNNNNCFLLFSWKQNNENKAKKQQQQQQQQQQTYMHLYLYPILNAVRVRNAWFCCTHRSYCGIVMRWSIHLAACPRGFLCLAVSTTSICRLIIDANVTFLFVVVLFCFRLTLLQCFVYSVLSLVHVS